MAQPTTALSPDEQRDCLATFKLTLDNFSLAAHVASLLMLHRGHAPPGITIIFKSPFGPCAVDGEKCGLFTTPVIQVAILDCRRSLEFFGITCDEKANTLKPIGRARRDDDLGIEHFGLPLVTVDALLAVTGQIESELVQVYRWSNKQLAHFTKANRIVMVDEIRVVSLALIQAFLRLLYDPLGLPKPRIQPSDIVELPDGSRKQNPPP